MDLKAQYSEIQPRVEAAIKRVLESGQFILGPEVSAFEERFAAYCQTSRGLAVNSGTSALHLALLAAGVDVGIHCPVPVHLQQPNANAGCKAGDLLVTDALAARFLSPPIYPELTAEQAATVTDELNKTLFVEAA